MTRRGNIDPTQMTQDSPSVDMALSMHEREIFENFLKKQAAEKAQTRVSNDAAPDSLRYLFTIFH